VNPETIGNFGFFKFAETVAPALNIKPVLLGVHDANEIERALTAFAAEGDSGFIATPNSVTFTNEDLIVALAARLRLPALYPFASYAKEGGLISYGVDPVYEFQQGAGYVDRILRGAKPADLPVQYPTKFQLVVSREREQFLASCNSLPSVRSFDSAQSETRQTGGPEAIDQGFLGQPEMEADDSWRPVACELRK
jgi:hypothetical protein